MNVVSLVGRLGKDPELKTYGDKCVTNFSIATSSRFLDKSTDTWVEKSEWHRLVVWNAQAKSCCAQLIKGSLVSVQGSLRTRKWESDQGTRYTTEIMVSRIDFLTGWGNKAKEEAGVSSGYKDYQNSKPQAQAQPTISEGHDSFSDDDDIPF